MSSVHPSHSSTPLLSWTGKIKYSERLMAQDKGTAGRDHSPIAITGKTDLRKN